MTLTITWGNPALSHSKKPPFKMSHASHGLFFTSCPNTVGDKNAPPSLAARSKLCGEKKKNEKKEKMAETVSHLDRGLVIANLSLVTEQSYPGYIQSRSRGGLRLDSTLRC